MPLIFFVEACCVQREKYNDICVVGSIFRNILRTFASAQSAYYLRIYITTFYK